MEELNLSWDLLMYMVISIVGQVANILFKLSKLEKIPDFSLKYWFKKNTFQTIGGFLVAGLLVFWLQSKGSLDAGTAVLIGYTADSAIKDLSTGSKARVKEIRGSFMKKSA